MAMTSTRDNSVSLLEILVAVLACVIYGGLYLAVEWRPPEEPGAHAWHWDAGAP